MESVGLGAIGNGGNNGRSSVTEALCLPEKIALNVATCASNSCTRCSKAACASPLRWRIQTIENRRQVAHGVSPSQRIFRLRHRSQAVATALGRDKVPTGWVPTLGRCWETGEFDPGEVDDTSIAVTLVTAGR